MHDMLLAQYKLDFGPRSLKLNTSALKSRERQRTFSRGTVLDGRLNSVGCFGKLISGMQVQVHCLPSTIGDCSVQGSPFKGDF